MVYYVFNATTMPHVHIRTYTQRDVLISDEITRILYWFLFVLLCQAITVFGICSNIINIICFMKHSFQDPVNVSLLGLAVSDLGCLLTLMWTNICYTLDVVDAELPFDPFEIQYVTTAWIHVAFSRVTAWITAIITLDRCLCVTFPLKFFLMAILSLTIANFSGLNNWLKLSNQFTISYVVSNIVQIKDIVTSKRMTIIMVFTFIVLLSTLAPVYAVNSLGMKYFPKKNKTLIGNIVTDDREMVERITFPINVLLPFSSFMIIVISTIILVYKLKVNSQWRMTSSAATQVVKLSTRNIRVAKMVTMIAVLFILCFAPMSIVFIGVLFEPRLSFGGEYINTLTILCAICTNLESVNSASNIFIYFHMSRKYKEVFMTLFCTTR